MLSLFHKPTDVMLTYKTTAAAGISGLDPILSFPFLSFRFLSFPFFKLICSLVIHIITSLCHHSIKHPNLNSIVLAA